MKKLVIGILALGSVSAHATSLGENIIANIETAHQLKCNFLKSSPRFSSVKYLYECKNQQGETKSIVKIIYSAHNSGQFLEIGEVASFEAKFNL